ncbi:actin filament organizing protein, putative [Candida dubliniensis CD36]|uniref:Actin patch protein, putative n=1 Tax=Candida dubliniensis (strain CD36 / ATCC MYA-646 / CBS 7987 / NCPF 3949 / NRRL Y-17841) TaxID=573826 RepID=B9WDC1_CANDC|nr:actin filament organizing protein, putative [Candida dubliniensis CD36]CAX42673.1 actin filament organizing protein, putative [Candida dubliniensis CD36]
MTARDEGAIPLSRRQRLMGLARNTRDNYIPKITGSVSSFASGASRAFTNTDVYDENGRILLPKDSTIQLFPSYTRYQDGKYFVDVQGWVFTPGVMNRKNRVVLSVVKQIMKQRETSRAALNSIENDSTMKQEVFNPDSTSSDAESIISVDSSHSSQSSNASINPDDVIKERLSSFFARSIPNTELSITIGSESNVDKLKQLSISTDGYGHFETTIEVPYKPSVIQASSKLVDTVFAFQDIKVYSNSGIGIISDIDDTVKLTGVIGEKMVLLRNLLTNEVSSWNIPAVIKWYQNIYKRENVNFFYVSNSPWQLFNTIHEYFSYTGLPPGSVHLKRYSGNIIASLLEPSSSRKRRALHKILQDFPDKKFVCIGDSGEHDLEAYVDLARSFPNRILSINIRYVEDSFSDDNDQKIYNEVIRLITLKRKEIPKTTETSKPSVNKQISSPPSDDQLEDLIDLSDTPIKQTPKKLPPMVPKKPTKLKGQNMTRKPPQPPPPPSRNKGSTLTHSYTDTVLLSPDSTTSQQQSQQSLPTSLPSSSNIASDGNSINEELPPLPPRRRTSPSINSANSHDSELDSICNSPGFIELEEYDQKGANWIKRIISSIHQLEGVDTKLNIFKDEDDAFFKNSCIELDELKKK